MGLLSKALAERIIHQMAPEDTALMMIKERAPDVYQFMRFGSATEENPLSIAYELNRGMDPGALLDALKERSRRKHLNSFMKDGFDLSEL